MELVTQKLVNGWVISMWVLSAMLSTLVLWTTESIFVVYTVFDAATLVTTANCFIARYVRSYDAIKIKFKLLQVQQIPHTYITFISPRIYKGSCIANFSEKEKTKKKRYK